MRQDILHENGKLLFENGDFKIGESDQQHVGDIFIAQQGEYKDKPLAGFGAINYLKRNITPQQFKRELKIQLEYDGYEDAEINTDNGIENLDIKI